MEKELVCYSETDLYVGGCKFDKEAVTKAEVWDLSETNWGKIG